LSIFGSKMNKLPNRKTVFNAPCKLAGLLLLCLANPCLSMRIAPSKSLIRISKFLNDGKILKTGGVALFSSEENSERERLLNEAEILRLKAERLKLEAEKGALELAREKLRKEREMRENLATQNIQTNDQKGSIKERFENLNEEKEKMREQWSEIYKKTVFDEPQADKVNEANKNLENLDGKVKTLERDLGTGKEEEKTYQTLFDHLLQICRRKEISELKSRNLVNKFAEKMIDCSERQKFPFKYFFSDYLRPDDVRAELSREMSEGEAFWTLKTFQTAINIFSKEENDKGLWEFTGTLANLLTAKSRAGDENLANMKRVMGGEDGLQIAKEMAYGIDDPNVSEQSRVRLYLSTWKSFMGNNESLDEETLKRLESSVFTEELLEAEIEKRKEIKKKMTRVGKLKGARVSEETGKMISASGLAAISITGLEDTEKIFCEVKSRLESLELDGKIRIFVLRDVAQIYEEKVAEEIDEDTTNAEVADILSRTSSLSEAIGELVKEAFARAPRFLIVAIPNKPKANPFIGGLYGSLAVAAVALGNIVVTQDNVMIEALTYLLGVQIAHEVGHLAVGKMKGESPLFPPRLIPGGPFGGLGTSLQLSDFPKNYQNLFDYSVAGPLVGIASSFGLLIAGLQQTAMASSDLLATFPKIPTYLLQNSLLVGSLTNSFLPNLAISAPDISPEFVYLHPMAFAGAAGLLISSLHCVPLGGTDGSVVLKSAVPEVPDSFRDIAMGIALPFFQVVASVGTAWQVWQAFTGNYSQEGLLSSFVPTILLLVGKFDTVVVDERPRVGSVRTAIALALQFFWLAVLVPMPLQNFLDGANQLSSAVSNPF